MAKIGKPRGLIDYMALTDEVRERAGQPPKPLWQHVFRARTILYTALWALVGVALVVALFLRSDFDISVAPVRNPTFVTLKDGSIRNTYDLRIRNKHGEDREFRVAVTGVDGLIVTLERSETDVVTVPADELLLQRVYLTTPADNPAAGAERSEIRIWVEDVAGQERASKDTLFNGRTN